MKQTRAFNGAVFGLLLAVTAGFSSIPDSIWHNDTNFYDLWNKKTLDTSTFWAHSTNWGVKNAGMDSAAIVTDGLAQTSANWNNLVWKYQADSSQKNVELRFSWHMTANPNGNSGFNMRGRCVTGTIATYCGGGGSAGWKIAGPQIDLGPTYTTDVWNSNGARYATGDSRCKIAASASNATAWQDLSYKISNDTIYMSYYPNGFANPASKINCSTYKLTASTDVAATSPGIIALQYETTRVSEFKNIQIRNLTPKTSAIGNIGKSRTPSHFLRSSNASFSFSIMESGTYSVKISGLNGKVVKTIQGTGPVSNQKVSLDRPGVFIVQMSSPHQTSLKRVTAF